MSEVLEIEVKPGWKKGTRITFPEKGKEWERGLEVGLSALRLLSLQLSTFNFAWGGVLGDHGLHGTVEGTVEGTHRQSAAAAQPQGHT